MGTGCSSDHQTNQHSSNRRQVCVEPDSRNSGGNGTIPILIRTAHCDLLRITAKELKSEWFGRWLKIEREIHRLECRNVLSLVEILKLLLKHLKRETENAHKSRKEIKKQFKTLEETNKERQEESLEKAFRNCLENYCNAPNKEKAVVLSRFRTNHEKNRILKFSMELSEKMLREEQENLEIYFMLYARQNEILCDIFDNKYGSKEEYQSTMELDKMIFKRNSVQSSLIKFNQAMSHLDLTRHQLEFILAKTSELSKKTLDNYGNEEFLGLQELNSAVVASYFNYSLANTYIPKDIALPSGISLLNSTVDEEIIAAVIESEKDKNSWESVIDSFEKMYIALTKDIAWIEEIFRQYIIPDFENSVQDYVRAKEIVQLERYQLIKERIFNQTNEYFEVPSSDSDILPYKEIYLDESVKWSAEKIPFCPVEPNEVEVEKEEVVNKEELSENSNEETRSLYSQENVPDKSSVTDISLIDRDQIYEKRFEVEKKTRKKRQKTPTERSSFLVRCLDEMAPNYNDLFSDLPRSSPEGYSGPGSVDSVLLK